MSAPAVPPIYSEEPGFGPLIASQIASASLASLLPFDVRHGFT
jgi:hypothetical protein